MGFLDLFVAALMPVLKVLLITGLGLFLALDRIDLLGANARHYMNNILIKITKTPPHLQGLVIGCCSAGNLGNLLLIIVPAVCMESNSPFGDSTICSTNGTTYASLSMALTVMEKIFQSVKKFTAKINLKMVLAPATIAAICGFIIGTVSPIRILMIGDSAPLRVIDSSASLLGEATIPCMTLIVGSNLLRGLRKSGVSVSAIAGIVAVRNIFLPIIGIGIVKAAHHLGMVESDSLYQFILLLQYALPPAMTVGVIAQLFEAGEGECGVIMLWSYALSALSLTLWSTFYMWLLQ
ncbi:hypothetical protein Peur_060642 [Populus x canadensis]